jgi:hypothetical protein
VDRTVSWLAGAHNPDAIERTLAEVDAAIAMVALGVAKTVRLVNLAGAEDAAFEATARAQAAAVAFALKRDGPDSSTLVIGPRLAGEPRLAKELERATEGSA